MTARLVSMGFAVPKAWRQEELAASVADAWGLDEAERARWDRIVRGTAIERRHAVADLASTLRMSTGERMRVYEKDAPPIALAAARQALEVALERSGVAASDVTDCIVVTCTGFMAPGIGAIIAPQLGLRSTVRHSQIGFMGCFGGILGLRAAVGAIGAEPAAVVLVVCVELCSLHIRQDRSGQNMVAAAIFADGAAAAVIAGRDTGGLGRITIGRSLILDSAADAMTWRVGDDGFAMTLTRDVPVAIERDIGEFLREGTEPNRPLTIVAHPGGAGILDAIERGVRHLNVDPLAIAASRTVLRDFGNMSSGSVLFVLDEYLRNGGRPPAQLVAFGPGLTVDSVGLV
jgi:alkylresorcinol/alkylpyrone synthase